MHAENPEKYCIYGWKCYNKIDTLYAGRRGETDIAAEGKKFWQSTQVRVTLRVVTIVAVAASLLLNLFTHIIPIVKYYGDGMSPTLEAGQILVLAKTQEVNAGDIIAFYYNNKILIRRVIATGGQQISMDRAGTVSVDGTVLDEPYVESLAYGQVTVNFPYNVPADSVFVMGDNRLTSMDSRLLEIGAVSGDRIVGKVLFSVFPPKFDLK